MKFRWRRVGALLLTAAMLLSLLPTVALAADETFITVDTSECAQASAGETVQIPVKISGNPGVAGIMLTAIFDTDYFEAAEGGLYSMGELLPANINFSGDSTDTANGNRSAVQILYTGGDITGDGTLFYLNLKVKADAKSGSSSISVVLYDDDKENFVNHAGDAVPVSFIPGTVAVLGLEEPALSFVNGAETVANFENYATADVTTVTEPVREGYIFLGWFKDLETTAEISADEDGYYTLSNSSLTEAYAVIPGTELRPKYDVPTGGGTYNALWLKEDLAKAKETVDLLVTTGTGETRYYLTGYTSTSTNEGAAALLALLDTAVAAAADNGRIKLVNDLTVSGAYSIPYGGVGSNGLLYVPAGSRLTLDLNGHTLGTAADFNSGSVYSSNTKPVIYVGYVSNGGEAQASLAVENSSSREGTVQQLAYASYLHADAIQLAANSELSLRDVTVRASNETTEKGMYCINFSEGHISEISGCTLVAHSTDGLSAVLYSGGWRGGIDRVENCSMESDGSLIILTYPENDTSPDGNYISLITGTDMTCTGTGSAAAIQSSGAKLVFGEDNTVTVANDVLFDVKDASYGPCRLTFTSTTGTYETTAENGAVYGENIIDVYPPEGLIAADSRGAVEFVAGYTVRFYDRDSTAEKNGTLRGSAAAPTGETVTAAAPSLTWANAGLTYYTHDGWTTDPEQMENGAAVDLDSISTDTDLYPVYSGHTGEAAIELTLNGETTQLLTMEDAYAAIKEVAPLSFSAFEAEIKLLADAEAAGYELASAEQALTFDLNGHTMTLTGGFTVKGYNSDGGSAAARLTFRDSSGTAAGVLQAAGNMTGALIATGHSANAITLEDVTLRTSGTDGQAAIVLASSVVYANNSEAVALSLTNAAIETEFPAAVQAAPANRYGKMTISVDGDSVLEGADYAIQVVGANANYITDHVSIALNGGRFKGAEGAIGLPAAGTVTVTCPEYMSLSSEPDAEGYYTVVYDPLTLDDDGTTIIGSAKGNMDADGNVTISGDLIVGDAAVISAGTLATLDGANSLTVDTGTAAVTFDAAATASLAALTSAVKLTVQDVTESYSGALDARKAVELTLTDAAAGTAAAFSGNASVAVRFTPAEGTGYTVYYVSDAGNEKLPSSVNRTDGTITFTVTHFSTYVVTEQQSFALTLSPADDAPHYDLGDTFTVNIQAAAPVDNTNINSFQFTLSYDDTKLALDSVSTGLAGTFNVNGATVGYAAAGTGPVLGTEAETIAAAVFTVISVAADGEQAEITLDETKPLEVTEQGEKSSPTPTVEPGTVTLHDIKITLAPGDGGAIDGAAENLVLSARYGVAGLYTDNTYTTARGSVEGTALAGYRLAEPNWADAAAAGVTYATYADIAAAVFTASATINLQTVRTASVSFREPAEGGTLTTMAAITVDQGSVLTEEQLADLAARPQPAEGYTFTKWQVVGETGNTDFDPAAAITADITLIPVFEAGLYAFSTEVEGAELTAVTGVTEADGAAYVTYGQEITFTVTAGDGYAVTEVRYYVGDAAATGTVLTAGADGTYTIPGACVTGPVKVEVTTVRYAVVTFAAGTGTTLAETAAYARVGRPGLFTDAAFSTLFAVPVPAANEGYRLAADTAAEPLWTDGATEYTSAGAAQASFSGDVTLTAKAVEQVTVTISAEGVAGVAGIEPEVTEITVDAGAAVTEDLLPTVIPAPGYKQDGWVDENGDPVDLSGLTAQAGLTLVPNMVPASYDVTISAGDGITVTAGANLSGSASPYTAVYGTDAVFTVSAGDGVQITRIYYRVNGGDAAEISADGNGQCTIPGTAITAPVSVIVESVKTYVVTFQTLAGGGLDSSTEATSVSKVFTEGHVLTADEVPAPNPAAGYSFDKWDVNPVGQAVTAAVTYTASFKANSYRVTWPDGFSGPTDTATYGEDLVFDPMDGSGNLLTDVKYQVGADGDEIELTIGADGAYTIPGAAITGDVTVIGTVTQFSGSVLFITYDQYKALESGTKIAVLTTASGVNDTVFTMEDGSSFYWSEKYKAYLHIVSADMTAAGILSQLTVAAGTAETVGYSGDVNGSGGVTAADAGMVNDTLYQLTAATELERLMMDVVYNESVSTAAVTTSDIQWILDVAVGKLVP